MRGYWLGTIQLLPASETPFEQKLRSPLEGVERRCFARPGSNPKIRIVLYSAARVLMYYAVLGEQPGW